MTIMRYAQRTHRRTQAAFTLVEMLVVLAIIGILVGILLPVIARSKVRAKAGLAKLDCAAIATAIAQYHTDYNHYPVAKGQVANPFGGDLTFSFPKDLAGEEDKDNMTIPIDDPGGIPVNSDAMIILSALEDLGGSKPNAGHSRNINKRRYLDGKLTDSKEKPGMGPDGVFRDPFGNPYVITVDFDGDGLCLDPFYATPAVSADSSLPEIGQNGLMKSKKWTDPASGQPAYVLSKEIMVWSPGPDRKVNAGISVKQGVNNDNIIGWQ